MLYPIILSGGVGKRLWPVSSQSNPKQFQKFFDDRTLLQITYQRILKGFDKKNVFLVGNVNALEYINSQIDIDQDHIIGEPAAKGTAMAIGLAALKLHSLDSEASLVIINSDHYIKNEDKYLNLLKNTGEVLDSKYSDRFVLAGIEPTYPETGYGYIKLGQYLEDNAYLVDSFKEKPDQATASEYIKEGYLWNPAIFLFKAGRLLEWYQKYMPDTYKALNNIAKDWSLDNLSKQYQTVENISIDYGLLEKLDNMVLVKTDIDWVDIGNWRSLRDVLSDGQANVSNVPQVSVDSSNNLFYSSSNKLVASIGLKDMVLVETDQVIFLCPADRAQDVKKILEEIQNNNLDKYL